MGSAFPEGGKEQRPVSKVAEESREVRTGKGPLNLASVRVLSSVRKRGGGRRVCQGKESLTTAS